MVKSRLLNNYKKKRFYPPTMKGLHPYIQLQKKNFYCYILLKPNFLHFLLQNEGFNY